METLWSLYLVFRTKVLFSSKIWKKMNLLLIVGCYNLDSIWLLTRGYVWGCDVFSRQNTYLILVYFWYVSFWWINFVSRFIYKRHVRFWPIVFSTGRVQLINIGMIFEITGFILEKQKLEYSISLHFYTLGPIWIKK